MKINRVSQASAAVAPKPAAKTRGTSARFSDSMAAAGVDGPSSLPAIDAASSLAAVSSVVAVQAVPDATEQNRKAARQGQDVLDALDELREGLLAGTLSVGQLHRLADMVSARRSHTDDPGLTAVLDQIELRARVELAKYERD